MRFSVENVHSRRTKSSETPPSKGTQTIDSLTANRTFPKTARLGKRHEFRRVLNAKSRFYTETMIIGYAPSKSSRLGITVSRSFGKAVKRNRFKRIVRESFRKIKHQLPPYDLVVQPKTTEPISLHNTLKDFSDFTHVLEHATTKGR